MFEIMMLTFQAIYIYSHTSPRLVSPRLGLLYLSFLYLPSTLALCPLLPTLKAFSLSLAFMNHNGGEDEDDDDEVATVPRLKWFHFSINKS